MLLASAHFHLLQYERSMNPSFIGWNDTKRNFVENHSKERLTNNFHKRFTIEQKCTEQIRNHILDIFTPGLLHSCMSCLKRLLARRKAVCDTFSRPIGPTFQLQLSNWAFWYTLYSQDFRQKGGPPRKALVPRTRGKTPFSPLTQTFDLPWNLWSCITTDF